MASSPVLEILQFIGSIVFAIISSVTIDFGHSNVIALWRNESTPAGTVAQKPGPTCRNDEEVFLVDAWLSVLMVGVIGSAIEIYNRENKADKSIWFKLCVFVLTGVVAWLARFGLLILSVSNPPLCQRNLALFWACMFKGVSAGGCNVMLTALPKKLPRDWPNRLVSYWATGVISIFMPLVFEALFTCSDSSCAIDLLCTTLRYYYGATVALQAVPFLITLIKWCRGDSEDEHADVERNASSSDSASTTAASAQNMRSNNDNIADV